MCGVKYFVARFIALVLLCCTAILISLPSISNALKSSRDENSINIRRSKNNSNIKQRHRKSSRGDDISADVRSSSSNNAASKVPLFNSLFWDEGMDVTRFHICIKAELSRVMLDLAAEEDGNTKKGSSPASASSSSSHQSHRRRRPTALVVGVEYGTEVIELAQTGFDVLGIEPFPEYVAHVVSEAARVALSR